MPRGKNYVNNNRGMHLQPHKKEKSTEQCFYGAGCTRTDCLYRHDSTGSAVKKSPEPCMPFLAGQCTFSAQGCRKRHPGKAEAAKLMAKYQSTKCRYGDLCKTKGCLYIHPKDNESSTTDSSSTEPSTVDFPPLPGAQPAAAPVPTSAAWRPAPPMMHPSAAAWYPPQGPAAYPAPHAYSMPPPWTQSPSLAYPRSQSATEAHLNIHAKEFVPSGHA